MWKLFLACCRCHLHLWWYFNFKIFLTFMNIMAAMTFKSFKLHNCHRPPALSVSDFHDLHRLNDHHYTIDLHKYLELSIPDKLWHSYRDLDGQSILAMFDIDVCSCRFSLPWLSSVFFRSCPPLVIRNMVISSLLGHKSHTLKGRL